MIQFFSSSIRGGLSYAGTRFAEIKEDQQIIYIDCTNLYGVGLSSPNLPHSNFRYVNQIEAAMENIMNIV